MIFKKIILSLGKYFHCSFWVTKRNAETWATTNKDNLSNEANLRKRVLRKPAPDGAHRSFLELPSNSKIITYPRTWILNTGYRV